MMTDRTLENLRAFFEDFKKEVLEAAEAFCLLIASGRTDEAVELVRSLRGRLRKAQEAAVFMRGESIVFDEAAENIIQAIRIASDLLDRIVVPTAAPQEERFPHP